MSATIDVHGHGDTYAYGHYHYPAGSVEHRKDQYAAFNISDHQGNTVRLYFDTAAEVDALIKAALAMRDAMAPAPTGPLCADCGAPGVPWAGALCPACLAVATAPSQPKAKSQAPPPPVLTPAEERALDRWDGSALAVLPAGHGPNHHDNAGHATHVTSGTRVPGCVTCESAAVTR